MTRTMKTLTTTCLLAVCALGLVSCGTPSTVKDAKKYMNSQEKGYENWSGTLVYNDGNLKVNVVSGKGSYAKDDYKVTFTVNYNWDDHRLVGYDKWDSKNGNTVADAAVKVSIVACYTAVEAAATAYANQNK